MHPCPWEGADIRGPLPSTNPHFLIWGHDVGKRPLSLNVAARCFVEGGRLWHVACSDTGRAGGGHMFASQPFQAYQAAFLDKGLFGIIGGTLYF